MRYYQPYGELDTDKSYHNGDADLGLQGSIGTAGGLEYPQREIVNQIAYNALTPSDDDLYQLLEACRNQFTNFCNDTGSVNALSVAFAPPLTAYVIGMPIRVRVLITNTGPSTLNAGPGAHPIKKPNGADLAPGDLIAGEIAEMAYDGTNFQLVNYAGLGIAPIVNTFTVPIPYVQDTSVTPNVIQAPFTPAFTSLDPGTFVLVKLNTSNTGPVTIYVNALPVASVKSRKGAELLYNDLVAGQIAVLIWNGTYWQNCLGERKFQSELIYPTAGTYTWTCPAGVFLVEAEVWGGGATGWNNNIMHPAEQGTDGPGGAAGGYAYGRYVVTPGTNYIITVGAGGNFHVPDAYKHVYITTQIGLPGTTSSFASFCSATGGSWSQITVGGVTGFPWGFGGIGVGGQLNLKGGSGFCDQCRSRVRGTMQGGDGFMATLGWGASAPRGGSDCFAYYDGNWPGGGGGGGDNYAYGNDPGYGADGCVILRF